MKFYHNYKSKFHNIHSYRNFQSCNELKTVNFMTLRYKGKKKFKKITAPIIGSANALNCPKTLRKKIHNEKICIYFDNAFL